MEDATQISDATQVRETPRRRRSAGPSTIAHANTIHDLDGRSRRRRSVSHLRLEHLDSSQSLSPHMVPSVDASDSRKSTLPQLSDKDRQGSEHRLNTEDSGVTKEDQRPSHKRFSAQYFGSNESATPATAPFLTSPKIQIQRPSSARSSLPANARPFKRSSTSGRPNSGPRRMSSSRGSSPSPVRRRRSVCTLGSSADLDGVSSPSGRRRRSDVDMIGKNRPSHADQPFEMPQTLMDHWTRRSIFQKARGVYSSGKSSQACETLKDKLHLAVKATHQGVRNTLLERHVVDCWQDIVKDRLGAKATENSETLGTNNPDLVPAAPDVLLEDFKSLSAKLEELKQMKAEQLPQSIQAALKSIDVKLDKFDILNDLMHMHHDSLLELSDKFASQIDGMAKMLSNLSWAFTSLYQNIQEEIAGTPKGAEAPLRTFLPAVEHCLVALGIMAQDLGVPKSTNDHGELETSDFEKHASCASNPSTGRTTSVRRLSRHGSMGLSDSIHATSQMLGSDGVIETEVVSEHVAPDIIADIGGNEAEDEDDDDLSSLGRLTDESDTHVRASPEAGFSEMSGASVEASADSFLQAEPALQAPPKSTTPGDLQLEETDTPPCEWLHDRSKMKQMRQSTWHLSREVKAYQWQAICENMEQSEDPRTPRLGSMFGRTISPCMKKVATWTNEASKEVCEAVSSSNEEVSFCLDSAAGEDVSTADESTAPDGDVTESVCPDSADVSCLLADDGSASLAADPVAPTLPVAAPTTVGPAPSKRELPMRDRSQVAKPWQTKPKYRRSNAKYSTDNLSVVQKRLLESIVQQDSKTPELLQIVCEASPAEYMPQASRCSPQYHGILPWDDNSAANCQSRPHTTGKTEGEQWLGVSSAPLPTINERPRTTPGLFGSLLGRNQSIKQLRPTPGSHKSLMNRRSQMSLYSLPVLVGR